MQQTSKPFTIRRWTLATFLGWLLGVVLLILLSSVLDAAGIEHMQFYIGIGMGAGVGILQWLVLRKYIPVPWTWVWVSALGMGIPFVLLDFLLPETVIYKLPLGVAAGAIVTGILQSRIIAAKLAGAYLWFGAALLGWISGAGAVLLVNYTSALKSVIPSNLVLALINLLLILLGGVVLGLVTGITLKRILPDKK